MVTATPFAVPPEQLAGKVAVITGASRGLGAGMASRLSQLGMTVALCSRNEPELPPGGTGVTASVDVADADAVDEFARSVAAELGPLSLWINNAGVLEPMGPQRDHRAADVAQALAINIGGVTNGTRSFSRLARTWDPGRRLLVNISSGAAKSVYSGWSIYGATKAAVDHFTEIVAVEEPDLICRSVAPGVVDTEMQASIRATSPEQFPAVERFHELHRTGSWNSPGWVADHLAGLLVGTYDPAEVVVRIPDEPRP